MASATQGLPALETGLQHLCVGCAAGTAVPAGTRQGRQASWALARPSLTPNHLRPSQKGQRGYDAGKRVKGRKRYIAVDTMGLLLVVVVHSTGIQDRGRARALLVRLFLRLDCFKTIFADGGYMGSLINWALSMFGWSM